MTRITRSSRPAIAVGRPLDAGPYRYVWIDQLSEGRTKRGRITDGVTAVATGAGVNGDIELLGQAVIRADDQRTWAAFFRDLTARGLSGVRVVVAGRSPGLEAGIAEALPGAVWQLDRDEAQRELLALVPEPEHALVVVLVNSIYTQPDERAVLEQHRRVVGQLQERFPEAARLLARSGPEMLAFAAFAKEDWGQILSSNPGAASREADGVAVRHQDANFFVVAPGQRRDHGNGIGGLDRLDRLGNGAIEGHARVRERPPSGRSRVIAFVKAPMTEFIAGAASRIDTLANVFTLPSPAGRRQPKANPTMWWFGTIGVATALAGAFVAHAINMFNFPRYELDEGTYISSAWSTLHGQISPYPYTYGHPPLGWFQLAIWTQLTGGFFTFGNALNSGRVAMLFYAAGSSFLIYLVAARLSGRRAVGLLAMVLFSFSPLSIVYQRQIYLDNIAVFWLLLSLYLVIASQSRLVFIVGAGLAFGCAVLSKETVAIFLPVMIYLLWLNISKYQRMFGLITFTYAVLGLGFGLVLLALMKGELFPYEWHLPWDQHPHLSLLDTLAGQVHRSQSEGSFADSWNAWTNGDRVLVELSIAATAFNFVVGLWKRERLFVALAAASYWAFLLRGGVVLPFYVIVLIPFMALNAALAVDTLLNLTRRFARVELAGTVLVVCLGATIVATDFIHSEVELTQQPTVAQTEAMVWIRNHVSHDSVVVINSYLYMDLREPGGAGVGDGATYPYAHIYWNIAFDPKFHDGLLQNNWDRIDYIVADSEMLRDIQRAGGKMTLIDTALQHSLLRQEFRADDNEQLKNDANGRDQQIVISIYQVVHQLPPSLALAPGGVGRA